MKNKNLICLFMAVLMFALVTPAIATEGGALEVEPSSAQADTKFSMMALGDTVVDVSVPTTGTLYINPLGFPVHYVYNGASVTDNSQILTEPAYIENKGENPVRVDVSVTGKVEGGGMTLASSSTKSQTTTSKRAFVYFEIKAVDTPDSVSWDETYDASKHVYVSTIATKSKKNIVELAAAADGADCYGAFRLTGDCVAAPKSSWTTADGVSVTIAFSFTPIITAS